MNYIGASDFYIFIRPYVKLVSEKMFVSFGSDAISDLQRVDCIILSLNIFYVKFLFLDIMPNTAYA